MKLVLLGHLEKVVANQLIDQFTLPNDLEFFFTGHSDQIIPEGQLFKSALWEGRCTPGNSYLRFITQSYFIRMDEIDKGWRTIIGLEVMDQSLNDAFLTLKTMQNWDDGWTRTIELSSNTCNE